MKFSFLSVVVLATTLNVGLAVLSPTWSSPSADDATRGLVRIKAKQQDNTVKEIELYKGSYALVIGVSDYTNGWPSLPGVAEDVVAVKATLIENGFTVITVMNPDAARLKQSFETFISRYGNDPDNRLLFYFSGHGHTMQPAYGGEPIGYIVPMDAPDPKVDPEQFKRMAMSMQRIEEFARIIDSKHAMFLFDSCFSGSLFALSRAIPEDISYKTALPVRQFITSGGEDEQVPDKSIFRQQFISGLDGEADANRDGYVTGTELSTFLQSSVINYSKGYQHPQYGKIRHAQLDKGDYVFAIGQQQRGMEVASIAGQGYEKEETLSRQLGDENVTMVENDTDALVRDLAERFKKNDFRTTKPVDDWTRDRTITLVFLDIQAAGMSDAEKDFLLNRTLEMMRESGRYTTVEREIMDKLIAELRLSNSDLADPATALKLGRILSAGLIATGSIHRRDREWLFSLRFIETETTNIATSVSSLLKGDDTEQIAAELSRKVTDKLNARFPLQGKVVSASGGSASINIGSAAGVRKDMTFQLLDDAAIPVGEVSVHNVGLSESTVTAKDGSGLLKDGMRVLEMIHE